MVMDKKAKKKPANPKPNPKTTSKASLMPATDKEWQIKDDARTLKEAMAIKGDPPRLKAAQLYCSKEMESMKQIQKLK